MVGPGEDEAPKPTTHDEMDAAATTEREIETATATAPIVAAPQHAPIKGPGAQSTASAPLQAKPTTAISSIDIQTLSFPDGSRGTFTTTPSAPSPPTLRPTTAVSTDVMSIASCAPTMRAPGDLASLATYTNASQRRSRAWSLLRTQAASVQPFESTRTGRVPYALSAFAREFSDVRGATHNEDEDAGETDEVRLARWRAKLKHYMILSSAGKPIWSRHGDLGLVNSYMGVAQTILSFFERAENPLQGFTAGSARFVIVTEGPLYLVAVSRLGESDGQLRDQLRALYMQILSTLTLPTLTSIFAHRPSTDLRKPLQGTEGLLASLADCFTKGSPSALLGALECLRLRKAQRQAITSAFLRQKTASLLYGLIVAGGRLVSVIRPRKHSLHPSDLQLIFNMLFESGSVKAGGGESWIPLCLPAFNSTGYLYMYVSFFDPDAEDPESPATTTTTNSTTPSSASRPPDDEAIAIILISPDKESFFDLQEMREKVAQSLARNGSLAIIRAAVAAGRPQVADLVRRPGAAVQISHFLYKSRANVQFAMSSLTPEFGGADENRRLESRRRLMTLYHQLHAAVHARNSHLKVLHCIGEDATSLGWVTPVFEFYCVAGPNASRSVVTQDANRIVQWAKREEERLFITGGGGF
ncbi:vacuolar fusion protein mon1 [Grosmannia clavigera kw1407]|uniref:Vacuolar fusion protein MON1 n=1 Tax=Grosmannia clavigera (strain kw1407 / UAMH 11150) TaxID=655863 RepID=F0X917_GROCL|nr:vacuolar fusion protein mon1 [Grosmannia clavigera kw1407]EFX05962.1 vacuolar fusion protein mon1 [Grosmannia clavigera kw1407]